jgi:hypothetical protein
VLYRLRLQLISKGKKNHYALISRMRTIGNRTSPPSGIPENTLLCDGEWGGGATGGLAAGSTVISSNGKVHMLRRSRDSNCGHMVPSDRN